MMTEIIRELTTITKKELDAVKRADQQMKYNVKRSRIIPQDKCSTVTPCISHTDAQHMAWTAQDDTDRVKCRAVHNM